MRRLTVDRFDGIYVICEDEERRMFAIPTAEMPSGVAEGDKLEIDDDGIMSVNKEATEASRAAVREKEANLFSGKKR